MEGEHGLHLKGTSITSNLESRGVIYLGQGVGVRVYRYRKVSIF